MPPKKKKAKNDSTVKVVKLLPDQSDYLIQCVYEERAIIESNNEARGRDGCQEKKLAWHRVSDKWNSQYPDIHKSEHQLYTHYMGKKSIVKQNIGKMKRYREITGGGKDEEIEKAQAIVDAEYGLGEALICEMLCRTPASMSARAESFGITKKAKEDTMDTNFDGDQSALGDVKADKKKVARKKIKQEVNQVDSLEDSDCEDVQEIKKARMCSNQNVTSSPSPNGVMQVDLMNTISQAVSQGISQALHSFAQIHPYMPSLMSAPTTSRGQQMSGTSQPTAGHFAHPHYAHSLMHYPPTYHLPPSIGMQGFHFMGNLPPYPRNNNASPFYPHTPR